MTSFKFTRHVLPALSFACALGLAAPAMAQTTPPPGSGMAPMATPGSTTVAPATSGKTTMSSGGAISSTTAKPMMSKGMKLPAGETFSTTALATAHCPGDTVVWSTLGKGKSYHMASSKYYGKTKHGAYVCQKDADAAGFHASKK